MPATYPASSIFLEAHFFSDDREELRLPCSAVTVERGAIVAQGLETRHLAAIRWMPDAVSFEAYQRSHRFSVGRPIVVNDLAARFPLR